MESEKTAKEAAELAKQVAEEKALNAEQKLQDAGKSDNTLIQEKSQLENQLAAEIEKYKRENELRQEWEEKAKETKTALEEKTSEIKSLNDTHAFTITKERNEKENALNNLRNELDFQHKQVLNAKEEEKNAAITAAANAEIAKAKAAAEELKKQEDSEDVKQQEDYDKLNKELEDTQKDLNATKSTLERLQNITQEQEDSIGTYDSNGIVQVISYKLLENVDEKNKNKNLSLLLRKSINWNNSKEYRIEISNDEGVDNPHMFGGKIELNSETTEHKFNSSIKKGLIHKIKTDSNESVIAFFKYEEEEGYSYSGNVVTFKSNKPDLNISLTNSELTFRKNDLSETSLEFQAVKGVKKDLRINNVAIKEKTRGMKNNNECIKFLNEGYVKLVKLSNTSIVVIFKPNDFYSYFDLECEASKKIECKLYNRNMKNRLNKILSKNTNMKQVSDCFNTKKNVRFLSTKKFKNTNETFCGVINCDSKINVNDIKLQIFCGM